MTSLRPGYDEALADWAGRVRANREQAERFREESAGSDFYAPIASAFRADPRRTDDPALDALIEIASNEDTWLDIGAGAGRYALPLALKAREVIALDPSSGMLKQLREGMEEHGVSNIRVVEGRWPMDNAPRADVALIAHVGYDIDDIGPFLEAMEASADRLCVAVLLARSPAAAAAPIWERVHGEPRAQLPALPEFLSLLLARGRLFEVRLSERPPMMYPSPEMALAFLRQQLFVHPGSEKDQRIQALVEQLSAEPGGGVRLSSEAVPLGVVSWNPRATIR